MLLQFQEMFDFAPVTSSIEYELSVYLPEARENGDSFSWV